MKFLTYLRGISISKNDQRNNDGNYLPMTKLSVTSKIFLQPIYPFLLCSKYRKHGVYRSRKLESNLFCYSEFLDDKVSNRLSSFVEILAKLSSKYVIIIYYLKYLLAECLFKWFFIKTLYNFIRSSTMISARSF